MLAAAYEGKTVKRWLMDLAKARHRQRVWGFGVV
jgi:hypothetical protein